MTSTSTGKHSADSAGVHASDLIDAHRRAPRARRNHPVYRARSVVVGLAALGLIAGTAGTASAKPSQMDDPGRGCPAGYVYVVAHCQLINHGGPGRRAI